MLSSFVSGMCGDGDIRKEKSLDDNDNPSKAQIFGQGFSGDLTSDPGIICVKEVLSY